MQQWQCECGSNFPLLTGGPLHYGNSPVQRLEKEQIGLVQAELKERNTTINEHFADPIQMSQYFPEDHFSYFRELFKLNRLLQNVKHN